MDYLDVPLARIPDMFQRMVSVIAGRYYPPDIEYVLEWDYLDYVVETIQMAYLGALFGLLMSIPLGWFGAYNMTPSRRFIYPVARLITMGFRAVHEMIWAILFVSILGFGMLPGVLALTFFCAGFAGKLFAEEIEAIDMGPVEAMRATGANLFQVMVFGVFPQVRVAFTGIGIYTWDVAFRAATVVGFVGAGGMGWYLKRAVLQIPDRARGRNHPVHRGAGAGLRGGLRVRPQPGDEDEVTPAPLPARRRTRRYSNRFCLCMIHTHTCEKSWCMQWPESS